MNKGIGEGMPLNPLLAQEAFGPETTALLAVAFDMAWDTIVRSGSPLAAERQAAATREQVARGIIDLAQRGERDCKRMVEAVLASVAPSDRDERRPGANYPRI